MKLHRRILAGVLALAAALSLSPALAAEENGDIAAKFPAVRTCEGFSDVEETAWYDPYVEICYETGLLSGTGGGRFRPEGTVSVGETFVMAAQLLWQSQGNTGPLPEGPTPEELLLLEDPGLDLESEEARESLEYLEPIAASWCWDGLACLVREALRREAAGREVDGFPLWHHPFEPASREEFFHMLAFAAADLDLPARNAIDALPDTGDETVLALYRAGILTGTDAHGTFAGALYLTRAEAAAALARVVRPELRLSFTPEPLTLSYTLEPVDLKGYGYLPLEDRYRFRTNLRSPSPASLQYIIYGDPSGWGVKAPDGHALTEPVYAFMGEFGPDGLAAVQNAAGKWGYLDREGEEIVPCRYDRVLTNHSGLLLARTDGTGRAEATYYLFDAEGKELRQFFAQGRQISMEADSWFADGLIPFRQADYGEDGKPGFRYGYLNEMGVTVIPARFDWAAPFSGGHAVVGEASGGEEFPREIRYHYAWRVGVIDTTGAFTLPFGENYLPDYYNPRCFLGGALTVTRPSPSGAPVSGAVDPSGEVLLPFRYDALGGFSGGTAFFRREGQMGFVSPDGGERRFPFSTVSDFDCGFSEGLIAVSADGVHYGYANQAGQLVIPARFLTACPVYQGRALVETEEGLFRLTIQRS